MFTVDEVRAATAAVQWVVMVLFVVSLVVTLWIGYRRPFMRPYLFLPLTLCVHGVLFYSFVLAGLVGSPWGNLWSALLRLHTTTALFGTLAAVTVALDREARADET